MAYKQEILLLFMGCVIIVTLFPIPGIRLFLVNCLVFGFFQGRYLKKKGLVKVLILLFIVLNIYSLLISISYFFYDQDEMWFRPIADDVLKAIGILVLFALPAYLFVLISKGSKEKL